jgi:hypothetical protein
MLIAIKKRPNFRTRRDCKIQDQIDGNSLGNRRGTAPRSYGCHAARLARKCPRAFLPSLIASVMLSKQTGERSTGADRPAQ